MSVKRYRPYIEHAEDTLEIICAGMKELANGGYVLHADYAALLARHNALCEAVKKERVACEQIGDAIFDGDVSAWAKADDACDAARAEVDRLLGEK